MKTTDNHRKELPPILWLGFPIASLLIFWLTPLLGCQWWQLLMTGEHGFVENGTFVFLLPAIVLGAVLAKRFLRFPLLSSRSARIMAAAMLAFAACAFYFAGEEIDWGQVWFHWKTPEQWAAVNYQQETSLHNIEGLSILNNIPRFLLLIITIVGGIILPLLPTFRRRPGEEGKLRYYLIPSWRIIPAAVIAACISLPHKAFEKGYEKIHLPSDYSFSYMAFAANSGEMKEYGFALVMLLYVVGMYILVRYHDQYQA